MRNQVKESIYIKDEESSLDRHIAEINSDKINWNISDMDSIKLCKHRNYVEMTQKYTSFGEWNDTNMMRGD